MELRNINTFLHIAELHSFSRTARPIIRISAGRM